MNLYFLYLKNTKPFVKKISQPFTFSRLGGQENASTVPGVYFLDQNKWNIGKIMFIHNLS